MASSDYTRYAGGGYTCVFGYVFYGRFLREGLVFQIGKGETEIECIRLHFVIDYNIALKHKRVNNFRLEKWDDFQGRN